MDGRRARKDANRKRLINAAFRLFESGGEEALTMRSLADEAGVSAATPYNLFQNKTGVLVAMFQAFLEELPGERKQAHNKDDALGSLLAVTEHVAALWSDPSGLFCNLMVAIRKSGELQPELIDKPMRGITSAMLRLQHEGWLSEAVPPETIAARIAHSNGGLFTLWLTGRLSPDQLRIELKLNILFPLAAVATDNKKEEITEALRNTLRAAEASRP